MQRIETVRSIGDPRKRLKAAVKVIDEARERAQTARDQRDLALITLHRAHGWKAVRCYELVGMRRSTFDDIKKEFPAKLQPIGTDDPDEIARIAVRRATEAAKYEGQKDSVVSQARRIRDEAGAVLLRGYDKYPPVWPAELARMTGLSAARISQIRYDFKNKHTAAA